MHLRLRLLVLMTSVLDVLATEQKPIGNFSTIFDDGLDAVPSFYENCSLAANVRVFDTTSFDFDWSTYMHGLDRERAFTIVLGTFYKESSERVGAIAMVSLCDFIDRQHQLQNLTFK